MLIENFKRGTHQGYNQRNQCSVLSNRLAPKVNQISKELHCDNWSRLGKFGYISSVSLVNILKTASTFILWQSAIVEDFNSDLNLEQAWNITAGLAWAAFTLFVSRLLYYLFYGDNNPVKHTNNFIETLEVGAFFYNLLSLTLPPEPQAIKRTILGFSAALMVLRNIDPDINILKNNTLGHKLPGVFADRSNLILPDSKTQFLTQDPLYKKIARYGLRSLHFIIPPTVVGISVYHDVSFTTRSATDKHYENTAIMTALGFSCLTSMMRLYDLQNAKGSPMRDLRKNCMYKFAKAESALAAFLLSSFQINYTLGGLYGYFNYLNKDEPALNAVDKDNLPWTIPLLFGVNLYLSLVAANDNKNMYEDFFSSQDKLDIALNYLKERRNLAPNEQNESAANGPPKTDWLQYVVFSPNALENQSKQSCYEKLQDTAEKGCSLAKDYFAPKNKPK